MPAAEATGPVGAGDGVPRPGPAAPRRERWIELLVAVATVALGVRLFAFVDRYAVDVLFSDQWDLWDGLFDGADLWTLWRWQHGPQRQGLGQFLIAAVAHLSGWNVRAELFVSAAVVCAAAGLALALVRAWRGRWSAADVTVPLVFLTLSQWEVFILTPNPSHGPLPLLLVASFGVATLTRRPALRASLLGAIAFVATQTGFALFLGIVAVPVLAALLAGAVRDRTAVLAHAAALALALASFALFFFDYRLLPAGACFRFPDPKPSRYLPFVSRLFLRPLESNGGGPLVALGLALAIVCAAMVARSGWRMLASAGRDRRAAVVFALSGFSLLFAANAAMGRACLGPELAGSSRYVPYLLPFYLAVHLVLSDLAPSRTRAVVMAGLCLLWATKELAWTRRASRADAAFWARHKAAWRSCYLASQDVRACTAAHPLGPVDVDASHLEEKLRFMREHRLGLFREGVGAPEPRWP
jgi:hypothetical protein